jgi:V/A-type H+/Na+-transporting ATPase subunit I
MLPERMSNLTLLCRNEDAERVTKILADLKAVHLTDHQKQVVGNAIVDIGKPFAGAEELSSALLNTRNMLAKLPLDKPAEVNVSLSDRLQRINELAKRFAAEEARQASQTQELQEIEHQLQILDLFDVSPIETLFSARSVENVLVRKNTRAIAVDFPHVSKQETEHAILFTVLRKDAQMAKEHLHNAHYTIVDLASLKEFRGSRQEVISRLETRKKLLHETQAASFKEHISFLTASEPVLALELLKAQAPLHFGTTKHITLVRGFIPTKRIQEFSQQLRQANINALLETTPAVEAPVALNNPKGAKDFESLIRLYTLPKYNEIDPTTLMAFTFPIFFGFMLGDIGYGLCALAAFITLKTMYPTIKHFANIFIISAISTIIFGVIYGEIFGSESFAGIHLTPLLHRTENIMLMFGIAIGIGIVHLNLGLLLGTYNERHDGWFFAVVKKGSWILLQIGAVFLAAAYGALPFSVDVFIAWPTFILAIIGIWHGEKAKGLLELPMIFSNTLSYTRLVALGLASVYMAFVINQIAGDLFLKGGAWVILGVFILLAGHALNLVLGLLGPFLHSLRLHYVEFFTKFYEGGGKPYKPFGGEQWQ